MTDWKERAGTTLRNMADRQQALGAKMRSGAEAGTDAFEKLTTFQLGLVADGVEAAAAQARLLTRPGEPLALVERQIDFVAELGEGLTSKGADFGEMVGSTAASIAGLFDVAPRSKGTARTRKAA